MRQNKKLKALQSYVIITVQSTVQHQICSYSEAVMSVPAKTTLRVENLKTVIHNVIGEGDRSKNLTIQRLKKESVEQLSDKVSCLFKILGEDHRKKSVKLARG